MWTGVDTPTNWHNTVASCKPCNSFKANRTPEQAGMSLRKTVENSDGSSVVVHYKKPKQPSYAELILGLNPYHLNIPGPWVTYIRPLLGEKMYKAIYGNIKIV